MEKKIILITGSTDGIGKITVTKLAQMGHQVIIHGRNREKAEKVKLQIIEESGNKDIDILIADLLSLSDIKKAANDFKAKYGRLDVLINNAGAIFGKERELSKDGFEQTMALNLFAPFLLIELLLPLLVKSASGRIINLSSAMHKRGGKPDFNDFQSERGYRPDRAYGLSKLYLIWVSRHLARELQDMGSKVTVNVCHPGAVATNFGQDVDKGFLMNLIFKLALYIMDKPEQGAKTSIYLATSPKVENMTGLFFGNKENVEKPDDKYCSIEIEQQVWDYCESIVKPYL